MAKEADIGACEIKHLEKLGKCPANDNGLHDPEIVGSPNEAFWGERIQNSTYDIRCRLCKKHFRVPYLDVHKKV